jgi:Tol biopolymer transport system component
LHLVYSNERGGRKQIYTMLANGTRVKPLTTQGDNVQPVWAKAIN